MLRLAGGFAAEAASGIAAVALHPSDHGLAQASAIIVHHVGIEPDASITDKDLDVASLQILHQLIARLNSPGVLGQGQLPDGYGGIEQDPDHVV